MGLPLFSLKQQPKCRRFNKPVAGWFRYFPWAQCLWAFIYIGNAELYGEGLEEMPK